jgi:hypothetical protein
VPLVLGFLAALAVLSSDNYNGFDSVGCGYVHHNRCNSKQDEQPGRRHGPDMPAAFLAHRQWASFVHESSELHTAFLGTTTTTGTVVLRAASSAVRHKSCLHAVFAKELYRGTERRHQANHYHNITVPLGRITIPTRKRQHSRVMQFGAPRFARCPVAPPAVQVLHPNLCARAFGAARGPAGIEGSRSTKRASARSAARQ